MRHVIAALVFGLAIGGAAANAKEYPVALTYAAPASIQKSEARLSLGDVQDLRKNGPNWLGAIRGGYGNALKTLVTKEGLVKDSVATVFRDGLAAREMSVEGGAYRLDVVIARLDSSQYARREAHVVFNVKLVSTADSATRFERVTTVDRVDGSVMSLKTGIFASTEDLRKTLNDALQQAIDETLDDPALRAAIAAPPPVAVVAAATVEAAAPVAAASATTAEASAPAVATKP